MKKINLRMKKLRITVAAVMNAVKPSMNVNAKIITKRVITEAAAVPRAVITI